MSQREIGRDGDSKGYIADVEKLLHLLRDRYKKHDTTLTQEEINLLEKKLGLEFPVAVRQFLCLLGNDYHSIFQGSDDSVEYIDEMQSMLTEVAEEYSLPLSSLPEDVFVISTYGSQQFMFMFKSEMAELDDPPLYLWNLSDWHHGVDERGRGVRRLSGSFSEFVNEVAREKMERWEAADLPRVPRGP